MRHIDKLVVHCTATTPDQDIGIEQVRNWHVQERGWRDVGYHFVIRRNGTLELGRTLDKIGAHVRGHNATSVGIALVGGLSPDGRSSPSYTEAQAKTLYALLRTLKCMFPQAQVLGHRDIPGVQKDCPVFDAGDWFESLENSPVNETFWQARTI